MNDARPALAITAGDLAGIGPEVAIKALMDAPTLARCRPLLVGDLRVWRRAVSLCGAAIALEAVAAPPVAADWPGGVLPALDVPCEGAELPAYGVLSAVAGAAAVRAVEAAIALALTGHVGAIVTAPLNKAAIRLAGYGYDGHTELLAVRTGAPSVCMLLAGERLRVVHVTGHRALRDAAVCPTPKRLSDVIRLTVVALHRLGIAAPRVAVAGLNPHAGEDGLFGRDEIDVIAPAVARCNAAEAGATITGPYPADTIFRRAAAGEFDAVIAMYHDQGHIPIKLIEFDTAVNVTLGLPIVRTSPDHGTAFDLAGRGVANPTNMIAAVRMAARMASGQASAT